MRSIRPLDVADIGTLQSIDREAHGEAWSHRGYVEDAERDDRVHLVAEDGGEIMGHASAWIHERCYRITNVATNPDQVGRGHATALMLALVESALEAGQVANMQLEVRPGNRRAQRLYGRFGFVPVGVERSFYDRPDAQGSRDALVMAVADVCNEGWRERISAIAEAQLDDSPTSGALA